MTCKHDWHFVDGLTKRLRCMKCAAMEFVNKNELEQYAIPAGGYSLSDTRPNSITFYDTSKGPQREVLRISAEGVTANPDIPVDEAAQAVIRALDGYIKQMIDKATKGKST